MNAMVREKLNDAVSDFRKKVREDMPEASREFLFEFAATIVEQELQEGETSDDIRAGALLHLKHRILKHGGDLLACSKCTS